MITKLWNVNVWAMVRGRIEPSSLKRYAVAAETLEEALDTVKETVNFGEGFDLWVERIAPADRELLSVDADINDQG